MKFTKSITVLSFLLSGMSACGVECFATAYDDGIIESDSYLQKYNQYFKDFEVPTGAESSTELTNLGQRNFKVYMNYDPELKKLRRQYETTVPIAVVKERNNLVLKMKELVRFLEEVRKVNQSMIFFKNLNGSVPYVEICAPSGAYHWKPVTDPDATVGDIQEYLNLLEKYISYAQSSLEHVDTDDLKSITVAHSEFSIQGVFSLDIPNKSSLRYHEKHGEGGDVHIGIAFALPKGVQQKSRDAFSKMLAYTLIVAEEVRNKYPTSISLSADDMAWKAYLRRGFVIPDPRYKDKTKKELKARQYMVYNRYPPAEKIALLSKVKDQLKESSVKLESEIIRMREPEYWQQVKDLYFYFPGNGLKIDGYKGDINEMNVDSQMEFVHKIVRGQIEEKVDKMLTIHGEILKLSSTISASGVLD